MNIRPNILNIAIKLSNTEKVFDINKISNIIFEYKDKLLAEIKPDCIITHGHRATALFRKTNTKIPIIGIAHTYRIRKLI